MIIVMNIVLLAAAGLIAYWWANQGFFSALLHLLCVIVAGAVAFAVWEPLTFMLMRGSWFDNYAWGMTLVVTFVFALLIMRVLMDKLAPANVTIPRWANLVFGGAAGAAAAVLTIGVFLVGAGHMQTSQSIMGFQEFGRSERDGHVGRFRSRSLWVPFHQVTTEFYSLLSVTSLNSPWGSLRQDSPELYKQVSLMRDTFDAGRGMVTLRPDAARVERISVIDDNTWFVTVELNVAAQDFGDRLTLSRSQIRLIGAPPTRRGQPPVVHPVAWLQHSGFHAFDNKTHYITNQPGKETSKPTIEFEVPPGFQPRYIQIRGTRFSLPSQPEQPSATMLAARARAVGDGTTEIAVGGAQIDAAFDITNSIRPLNISSNQLPAAMKETEDHYLTSGKHTFAPSRGGGSRKLKIKGIYEPQGTRVVRLDVSRGSVADIFRFLPQEGEEADIAVVDSEGTEYRPIGYFYKNTEGYTLALLPVKRIRSAADLPVVPTSGDNKLELLFYITADKTLTGLRFGGTSVGTCSVFVEGRSE